MLTVHQVVNDAVSGVYSTHSHQQVLQTGTASLSPEALLRGHLIDQIRYLRAARRELRERYPELLGGNGS